MKLKEILQKIKTGELNYGEDRDYYFFLDEDGVIQLLKRSEDKKREGWSSYDDEVIWEQETSYDRGLDITSSFLDALDIDYLS